MSDSHDHDHDHDHDHAHFAERDAHAGMLPDRGSRGLSAIAELVQLARSPAAWQASAPEPPPEPSGDAEDGEDGQLGQLSRRAFFRLAGAGAAAAGLAACSSRPAREILPYGTQPPELTPGVPLHYAARHHASGWMEHRMAS